MLNTNSLYFTAEHDSFRQQARRFVQTEIQPNVDLWEKQGFIPREFYKKTAEAGLFGLGYPENLGGTGIDDAFFRLALVDELCNTGAGGVIASLYSMDIGLPPILALGTKVQKERFIPPVLAGEKIAALAITEPSGGSDVANLQTRAVLDGDDYIVNGQKTFITSGMQADFYTVAVRTSDKGLNGVSLLVIEKNTEGFEQQVLHKMGWRSSDTATLYFKNCRVPKANLIGAENMGFMGIMMNFNAERLGLAAQACGLARVCLEQSIEYAKMRQTFGKPLIKHQVIRHKLTEMQMKIQASYAYLYETARLVQLGKMPIVNLCLLKNMSTETLEFCANQAVQIFGGAGFMEGTMVERIYRETKVLSIGGGATEIMFDLAARQQAW